MSFLDPAFLFSFLPITLLLFALAGRTYGSSGACAVIILATLVFCLPYGWPFVTVVIVSALVNQAGFAALVRPSNLERTHLRRQVFLGTLIFNLGVLIAIKYGVLFEAVPGAAPLFAVIASAIPITISFFTFQRIVMLFDAYQKRPETTEFSAGTLSDHLRLGAFSLMFPNLLIGPIAYISEIGTQLNRSTFGKLRLADFEVGLTIVAFGLAKKILIADPLDAYVVVPIFGAAHAGHAIIPVEAVAGMLGFYAQLYFDFSGYSDIAIGVARLFGLELPINFNSPLRATGIVDFWKRWHITLTRVIARLLFTPLAVTGTRFALKHGLKGTQFKLFTSWMPFLANFAVIGLWHGARWTYVAFGLYQGVWFILETEVRLTKRWKGFVKRTGDNFRRRAGQILMFVPLVIGFAIFRSESMTDFGYLMGSLGNDWLAILHSSSGGILNTQKSVIYLTIALAIIWLCPNVYEFLRNVKPGILTWTVPSTTPSWMRFVWRPTLIWAAFALVLGLFVIVSLKVPTPFDYGGF
jgi:alginate O-acetyltransferase complex protein AlgI